MTLRNRTVLLLTEISNWLGASRTVGSKYRKDKCLKEYVVVQPSGLKFNFFLFKSFSRITIPQNKWKKIFRIKNSSQILPKCKKQLYPARVAKDYKYEKKCSLVHKSPCGPTPVDAGGGDGGEEC